MKGRTSIVVAHRLTTVEKCNRVAVIEDGVVTEEGTFSDLQKNQAGYFQSLENKKWISWSNAITNISCLELKIL